MDEEKTLIYKIGDKVRCIREFVVKPSKGGFKMNGKLEEGKIYIVVDNVNASPDTAKNIHNIPIKGFWKEEPDQITYWNDYYLEYVLDKKIEEYM
jgi:hypothetical protein